MGLVCPFFCSSELLLGNLLLSYFLTCVLANTDFTLVIDVFLP